MLTPFGKFCRKLRIDNGELLKDMAAKLGVTSSYLSAVENGKRNVPQEWVNKIANLYSLADEECDQLSLIVQESQRVIKIDFGGYSAEDKSTVLALARQFKGLDEEKKILIQNILSQSDKRRD